MIIQEYFVLNRVNQEVPSDVHFKNLTLDIELDTVRDRLLRAMSGINKMRTVCGPAL